MPTAAIIGAVGSLGAAGVGAYSASKASSQQAQQQQNALAAQTGMFNTARGGLQPFIDNGAATLAPLNAEAAGGPGTALGALIKELQGGSGTGLAALKGLTTPGSAASVLATMPGFQFQSQYGTQAATNALAARGLGGSAGPVGRAVSDYNQGLAGTYYNNSVNALQGFEGLNLSGLQNAAGLKLGSLQNIAGLGSGAAGALAGNATATGTNLGQTYGNIGSAQAAGTLGTSNALASGITGAANSYTNNALINKLGGLYGGGSPGNFGGSPESNALLNPATYGNLA